MADIVFGDDMKKELRLIAWYLRRKYKTDHKITAEMIHEDMQSCGNPVIAEIYDAVIEAGERIEEEYQQSITIDFPELILWILYRDTAYLPVFIYILKNLMDKKDELMPFIEKYYVKPEDWYVNRWHKGLGHTKEMKERGELSSVDGHLSFDEQIFVPQYQQKKLKKINEMIEKERKQRSWK